MFDPRQIRAVTFDVGGTLIEPWPSVGQVYAQVAAEFGFSGLNPAQINQLFASAWAAKTQFDYSKTAWKNLVDAAFADTGCPPTPFFDTLYNRFTQADCWRLFPDVHPTLERLRQAGFSLGAISNWDDRLRPLLQNLNLHHYFQTIIVSAEFGTQKPDPVLFHHAARQLQLPPHALLHVGDNPHEDLQGALQAGCSALLINRSTTISSTPIPTPDHSISSLLDLVPCLLPPCHI